MFTFRIAARRIALPAAALAIAISGTGHAQEVRFIASTAALEYAARAYRSIWDEHGADIVAALEARTCLAFVEESVSAIIADAVSHSGGPEHPMQLRASYAPAVKQSTLVHELGHRHLWQLVERLEDIDGHRTLYLILDLVWADVWGEDFAQSRVRGESDWETDYDYADAWRWARSLDAAERGRLWRELLMLNGLESACEDPVDQDTRTSNAGLR